MQSEQSLVERTWEELTSFKLQFTQGRANVT